MNGTEILITWLAKLGDTRTHRPAGAPLPFRTVRRIGGPADDLTDHGVYSVSTYADTETEAADHGVITHRRVLTLAGPGGGQISVSISTGDAYVDDITVIEGPRTMKFTDTIWRSVATYQVVLRSV